MFRYTFLCGILFVCISTLSAKENLVDSLGRVKTITIDEVVVSAVSGKFQAGTKEQEYTQTQMQTNEGGNLGQMIAKYSPVYIKSDAGGISSIRIRGTSSNQTSVFFGGIDINSMTLGSSNLSNIPVFLFDQINLQYGSSSAENGSGSIGGSIRLGMNDLWTKGVHFETLGLMGSFGECMAGAKLAVGNGTWESVTRYSHYSKANDFPFLNTSNYNFNTQSYTRDKQHYSSIKNSGVIQELKYRFSPQEWIKGMVWIENDWHQQQPSMTSNESTDATARNIQENNQRAWIEYNNRLSPIHFHIATGFSHDKMVDSGNETNSISTQRWIGEAEMEQNIGKNTTYKAGIKYKYIVPKVYAYDDNIREQHTDVYASLYKQFFKKLSTTLNLRQQWVTRFSAPLTPALGAEYLISSNEHSYLKSTGTISRSYRIPTLNDRYWNQNGYEGNSLLKPEEGMTYETGLKYTYTRAFTFRLQAQFYYMNIKNWVLWVNGASGAQAKNVQRVLSKGIELHGDLEYTWEKITLSSGFNTSYNAVVRKESINSTDILNQQLEYSPKWISNVWVHLSYINYGFTADGSYVGERYYDQLNKLKAYTLLNTGIYGEYIVNKHKLRLSLNVQNVMSTQYQNQYNYAMPEINYQLNIKYIFN